MYALREFLSIEAARPKGPLYVLAALAILVGVIELLTMTLIVPAVALIGDRSALVHVPLPHGIAERLAAMPWRPSLLIIVGLLVAGYTLKSLVQVYFQRRQTAMSAQWQRDLAVRLLGSALHSPYQLHVQRHSAELIRHITVLVHDTYGRFLGATMSLFADAAAATALIVLSLVVAPLSALAAGTLMAAIYTLQHRIFQHMHGRMGAEHVALLDKEQVALQQSFDAFREMRVARREPFFLERFAELQDRICRNARAYEFSRRLPSIFGEVVIIICIALAVVILVRRAPEPGEVTIGLGLLAAVAFRLSPLANRIVGAVGTIENTSSGLSILAAELATASSQTRQSSAYGPPVAFRNSIELKGVSLAFFGRDRPALRTVDLTLRPGEAIGIVGPSGSGKTTLADILLGLLQPTEGTMTIDGEPAEKGRHVNAGYVPQDILLFDDTLRANVAFGVPPSTVSDDHVHHLLKVVQLTDLVEQLPDGLDARLGERGRLISGGQRQRIGIARALYHAPDLLVLDEATSALDAQTEERIAEAIAALRGTVTIVAIAHRLSTVRNCDRIVLLDDGEIIDQGSFDDLNARNAAFRSMVRLTIPGAEGEQRREGSRPRLPAKSS